MTANEVDRAIASSIEDVGPRLLAIAEDQWFDRKSIRAEAKTIAPLLVALANAEGGTIIIGLSDGVVEGIKAQASKLNDYRQAAVDHTVPPVGMRIDQVRCINSEGKPDSLIVIRVDPSENVHELRNGECYLRIGDEARRLRHEQRQELEFDKGRSQYDGHPVPGASLEDLDATLIGHFRTATGATGTTTNLLKARSLIARSGEPTNAAVLLFGKTPESQFPQAHVRVIKYLSTERGTGSRLMIEDDKDVRVEGAIPAVISQAAELAAQWIPRRRALRESHTFESEPIVPRDAWLEGLVNAVIHRSYSLAGDHIRFEIYPDRVEIESPGRFPGLANPSRPLDISRFARNPRIARVCADLRIGQELGEGIKRMFEEMRRSGLTDPIYQQGQGSVRLVLQAMARIDERTAARLPSHAQDVLNVVRAAVRGVSTGDVAAALRISRPYAKKTLDALRAEGFVNWHGKSAKDPRATWTSSDR